MRKMITTKQVELLNKLEPLATEVVYNKDTNTTEVGGNLYVDGKLGVQSRIDLKDGSSEGIYFINVDNDNEYVNISVKYDDKLLVIDYNFEGIGEHEIFLDTNDENLGSHILTSNNTKTLFGNQSMYGSGNIDLYKHYLTITAKTNQNINNTFNILIQSSSNVDCSSTTGTTQKLKDLLKVSGSESKYYENGVSSDGSTPGILLWNGTLLVIVCDTEIYNITSITDRVETL